MFLISKYAIQQRYKGTYKVPTEDSSRVEVLGKFLPGVCGVVRAAARGEEKSLVNKHGQTVASSAGLEAAGRRGKCALLRQRQTSLYLGKLT